MIEDEIDSLSLSPINGGGSQGGHLNEKFIKFTNQKSKIRKSTPSFCNRLCACIFPCFRSIDTVSRRHVNLLESNLNYTPFSNEIVNNKYNVITFIPVVLFNQFKLFGNFFYLIMTITQFFDELKVGFLFSYLSPLVIVVGVSMLKELYDDIYRRIQDKKDNNELYMVHKIVKEGMRETFQTSVKAKDLKIGDIIELHENQRVPADILVLKTFNEAGDNHSFIRTDQLDGETDWKLRKALALTQDMEIIDIMELNGFIEYEPPSKLIYNFEGVLQFCENDNTTLKKEPIGLENTMWSSTVLASDKIIGIVIYTGIETRARMNSSKPKIKIGILDQELNWINVYLFGIMFILSLILTLMRGHYSLTSFFIFFRFIVLFCGIIPISLRVNLDVSKTFFSVMINRDKSIPETIARNSTIPEELGRITYVFSDKTGTLTKNEMVFKQIAMETDVFTEESFPDLKLILEDDCKNNEVPLLDMINENSDELISPSLSSSVVSENCFEKRRTTIRRKRRNRDKIIRDTITSMVLCNNVTPIVEATSGKITYQASSPDEVALVKFAESVNMKLTYRTDKEFKIINANGVQEEYEILANFPFSSDTKRMGIVVKNKKFGHIIFYLKGAENVIEKFVKPEYIGYIKENAENLASKGLRTLVLTEKIIPKEEFDEWFEEYTEATTSMENRKEKIAQSISKLEKNMDFLCVTGVEDLLQDKVSITLENLRNAGMKVWMLTGDKIETATCISISAGLKAKNHKIYTIRYDELDKEDRIESLTRKFESYRQLEEMSHLLIIDGDTLDLALHHLEADFFRTAMSAPSVVCCRCSPTQKRIIVKTIKKYTDKRTAAVGDGGNDVAMIQEADVGIGIVGKEGLQASLSSDFSITQFCHLNTLLLWWGRLAYKNTSSMCNFVIHRGLIISLIQFIFSWMFYCNAVALYNGMLILGYSTIYTNFPAVSVLLDRDTEKKNVLKYPALYKGLLSGRELGIKMFLWWVFKSIFQSSVIMFGAVFSFKTHLFLNIVTITFTTLIFNEILNVYTEIQKFNKFMIFSLIGTGITYLLSILLLPSVLEVSFIFENKFNFIIIGALALIGWLPFFLINRFKKCCFPETYEKLNYAVD